MTCRTNILLLTDCLADLAGGAEKQIYELAKRLDKNRFNVFVVSLECWGQAPRDLIESTSSRLDIFRVVRIYGISGIREGIRFFHFLRQNRIKIILTYHFSSDMWGTFWGHLAGVPVIMSNRRDMGFWRKIWHVWAYKLMNRWGNRTIVVAKSIKQKILDTEGLKPESVEVIYNGVDLPPSQESDPGLGLKIGLNDQDMVIMHVANLKPVKGHKYLMEAFADVVKEFPRAKLVLIGKDELNGQLGQMASRLGVVHNVLFLGKREDVPQLLMLADICVLPSLSEGLSNSILEYMAASKPVIATKVGGNSELVIHGSNGLLVEKENASQLKEALLELLRDKEKRQNMGHNGLTRARSQFSMECMMVSYEQLFNEIVSSASPPRNDTIRVLHLVSSGGLFGAERVILNLTTRSTRTDAFVGALYNLHNPHLEIIEEAGRLGLKNVSFESRGQFDGGTIRRVRNFLVSHNIDILHTHNYKADIIGYLATRWTRVKWIATNHVWHSTDAKLRLYEAVDALVLRSARKVICVSNQIQNDLLKIGFKKERLAVIDNGVSIEKFSGEFPVEYTRKRMGVQPQECAVVIVGRLAKEKGHEIFLQAAREVIQKSHGIKFIIAGDGPLKGTLIERTQALNLTDHVVFTGLCDDMPALYASCDIMVNASYIEGLPMTILEAMASRLPVIATNIGGVKGVIQNQHNGILIEPGDPQALANAILELAADVSRRKRLVTRAYQDVCDQFSDRRMAERYGQIYDQVMEQACPKT